MKTIQKKAVHRVSNPAPLPDIEAEALNKGSVSEALEFLRLRLKDDTRAGASRLIEKFEKRTAKDSREVKRLQELWKHEKKAETKGFRWIAGIDEAGRGPLAGPVVAAAVILRAGLTLTGVNDSKKLTAIKREKLFTRIQQSAVGVGVGQASVAEIDELNIYRAAQLAMERAVGALNQRPDYLLTDAMPLPSLSSIVQEPLIHGDALSASIAAASIIAKVTRDRLLTQLHQQYPAYGFDNHKGYGTESHLAALENHGPCPEHRLSFGPVMVTLSRKFSGGPFGYWKEKLARSQSLRELNQTGIQIKRVALSHLSPSQLDGLRDIFRAKRNEWESPKG
jgi:ribonuclease HII